MDQTAPPSPATPSLHAPTPLLHSPPPADPQSSAWEPIQLSWKISYNNPFSLLFQLLVDVFGTVSPPISPWQSIKSPHSSLILAETFFALLSPSSPPESKYYPPSLHPRSSCPKDPTHPYFQSSIYKPWDIRNQAIQNIGDQIEESDLVTLRSQQRQEMIGSVIDDKELMEKNQLWLEIAMELISSHLSLTMAKRLLSLLLYSSFSLESKEFFLSRWRILALQEEGLCVGVDIWVHRSQSQGNCSSDPFTYILRFYYYQGEKIYGLNCILKQLGFSPRTTGKECVGGWDGCWSGGWDFWGKNECQIQIGRDLKQGCIIEGKIVLIGRESQTSREGQKKMEQKGVRKGESVERISLGGSGRILLSLRRERCWFSCCEGEKWGRSERETIGSIHGH